MLAVFFITFGHAVKAVDEYCRVAGLIGKVRKAQQTSRI